MDLPDKDFSPSYEEAMERFESDKSAVESYDIGPDGRLPSRPAWMGEAPGPDQNPVVGEIDVPGVCSLLSTPEGRELQVHFRIPTPGLILSDIPLGIGDNDFVYRVNDALGTITVDNTVGPYAYRPLEPSFIQDRSSNPYLAHSRGPESYPGHHETYVIDTRNRTVLNWQMTPLEEDR